MENIPLQRCKVSVDGVNQDARQDDCRAPVSATPHLATPFASHAHAFDLVVNDCCERFLPLRSKARRTSE